MSSSELFLLSHGVGRHSSCSRRRPRTWQRWDGVCSLSQNAKWVWFSVNLILGENYWNMLWQTFIQSWCASWRASVINDLTAVSWYSLHSVSFVKIFGHLSMHYHLLHVTFQFWENYTLLCRESTFHDVHWAVEFTEQWCSLSSDVHWAVEFTEQWSSLSSGVHWAVEFTEQWCSLSSDVLVFTEQWAGIVFIVFAD